MFYDTRNRQRLATLLPSVQARFNAWYADCAAAGQELLLTAGVRTPKEQQALYDQGRTKPGKIVTNARGVPVPQSNHCFGVAVDFVPADAKGKLYWGGMARFKAIADIGKKHGLEWGGDWKSFPDFPHLQFTGGLSLTDLQKGKRP